MAFPAMLLKNMLKAVTARPKQKCAVTPFVGEKGYSPPQQIFPQSRAKKSVSACAVLVVNAASKPKAKLPASMLP